MAQSSCTASNQRVGTEGRKGMFTLLMSPSFQSLTLGEPCKAAQMAPLKVKDLYTENHTILLKERRDM